MEPLILGGFFLLMGGGFVAYVYRRARTQLRRIGIKDMGHLRQLAKSSELMQAMVLTANREEREQVTMTHSGHSPRSRLARLRKVGLRGDAGALVLFDPDFSPVVFEDFAHALFARVHAARGGGRLDTVGVWLTDEAFDALQALGEPAQVKAPVVGSLVYEDVTGVEDNSPRVRVSLRFEAHSTEVDAAGVEQGWYVAEAWTLERSSAVRSRAPETVGAFTCPNCGAAPDAQRGATCYGCNTKVNTGEFDWVVRSVRSLSREQQGPRGLGPPEKRGQALPTLRDAHAQAHLEALERKDPDFTLLALRLRMEVILQELRTAASQRDWQGMRPFVGDNLFLSRGHEINVSREAGLRHVTEQSSVNHVSLARLTRDAFYDALTVRMHGSSLDYTVRDPDEQVVGGSPDKAREFSEYWTLVRRRGVKGAPGAKRTCPSCAASLSVDVSGKCTHCQAHVTSGAYDWVLHRIEQDAAYRG